VRLWTISKQASRNRKIFQTGSQLFLKKYKHETRFLEYFTNEWLSTKDGWFEGLQLYSPNSNNALEATNRVLKDEDTLRERLMLSRFTAIVFSIVEK
jgi:hypothetical protein